MKEIKFLQTGDLHLETCFEEPGFSLEMARRRRDELKEMFSCLVRTCQEEKVDLLLITGDLFDYRFTTKSLLRFMQKKLLKIPQVRVFITPGCSDPAFPDSYYRTFAWPSHVHIFLKEEWEPVDLPRLDLRVYGLGWNRPEVKEPLLRGLKVQGGPRVNLVMFHGDSFGSPGESSSLPAGETDLKNCGADYIALGHLHQYHRIPAKGKIIACYAGSPEPLGFGEPGEHGALLGSINKSRVEVKFIPLAKRQFIQKNIRVKSNNSLEQIKDKIKNAAGEKARAQHIFRFKLGGENDGLDCINLEKMKEELAKEFFYLDLLNETVPAYDLEAVIKENLHTAPGIFALKMKEEREKAVGEEQLVLEKALYYGLDSLLGKKVTLR